MEVKLTHEESLRILKERIYLLEQNVKQPYYVDIEPYINKIDELWDIIKLNILTSRKQV